MVQLFPKSLTSIPIPSKAYIIHSLGLNKVSSSGYKTFLLASTRLWVKLPELLSPLNPTRNGHACPLNTSGTRLYLTDETKKWTNSTIRSYISENGLWDLDHWAVVGEAPSFSAKKFIQSNDSQSHIMLMEFCWFLSTCQKSAHKYQINNSLLAWKLIIQ